MPGGGHFAKDPVGGGGGICTSVQYKNIVGYCNVERKMINLLKNAHFHGWFCDISKKDSYILKSCLIFLL